MPASTSAKGLKHGWSLQEAGWGPDMSENMLVIDAMIVRAFSQKRSTTVSATRTYGYHGGYLKIGGAWTNVADGTIVLAASLTHYVEVDPATGTVSANTVGFTAASIPMAVVVTGVATINSVTDARPLVS